MLPNTSITSYYFKLVALMLLVGETGTDKELDPQVHTLKQYFMKELFILEADGST